MIQAIKTFIESSDLEQATRQRKELINEIYSGILNRSDYADELVCLGNRTAELTGGLFEAAFNMANSFGRTYLIEWILNHYKILSIHKSAGNWFYIETKSVETGTIYFSYISQCSDCKSGGFGDVRHFERYKKSLDLIN